MKKRREVELKVRGARKCKVGSNTMTEVERKKTARLLFELSTKIEFLFRRENSPIQDFTDFNLAD